MSDEFHSDDQTFIARAKQVLDQTADELDPAEALKLQRTRISIASARAPRRAWLLWVGGVAMASIAAVAFVLWLRHSPSEHSAGVLLEDVELVISSENVELAEDIDFYHWLADDDSTG